MKNSPLLERLAALDSCAVSDAMDRFGLRGVALGLQPLSAGRRIVGRAVTVQLGPDDGQTSKRHLCAAAVDAAGPDEIIVIAHEGRMDVAGWGGILSRAACRNRIAGVVIDGACRDLDESRKFDLPVYARAAVPVTARGRVAEKNWNLPVIVAGVRVEPGDLVIADASGVVFLSAARADEVLGNAEQIVEREHSIASQIDRGLAVSEAMGVDYESMLGGKEER